MIVSLPKMHSAANLRPIFSGEWANSLAASSLKNHVKEQRMHEAEDNFPQIRQNHPFNLRNHSILSRSSRTPSNDSRRRSAGYLTGTLDSKMIIFDSWPINWAKQSAFLGFLCQHEPVPGDRVIGSESDCTGALPFPMYNLFGYCDGRGVAP